MSLTRHAAHTDVNTPRKTFLVLEDTEDVGAELSRLSYDRVLLELEDSIDMVACLDDRVLRAQDEAHAEVDEPALGQVTVQRGDAICLRLSDYEGRLVPCNERVDGRCRRCSVLTE